VKKSSSCWRFVLWANSDTVSAVNTKVRPCFEAVVRIHGPLQQPSSVVGNRGGFGWSLSRRGCLSRAFLRADPAALAEILNSNIDGFIGDQREIGEAVRAGRNLEILELA